MEGRLIKVEAKLDTVAADMGEESRTTQLFQRIGVVIVR